MRIINGEVKKFVKKKKRNLFKATLANFKT